MSGGGGKGGSSNSSSQVKIPAWLEDAARANMARADKIAQIGYTPYYGPDVAAFNPTQQAAFKNTADAASAFGMAAPADPMAGMPQAQVFANGLQGYSSAPLYQQTMDAFAAARPGQFAAMSAPFINPITGAAPATPFGTGSSSSGGNARSRPSSSNSGLDAFMSQIQNGNGPSGYSGSSQSYNAVADRDRQGTTPYQQAYNDQTAFLNNSNGGVSRSSGMGGGK